MSGWQLAHTCGVVVTYHPDESFPDRLARLTAVLPLVIVVDNHSTPDELDRLRAAAGPAGRVIANGENLGVASALNIGCRLAADLSFSWVLTFDQDSVPLPSLLPALAAALTAHPSPDRVGMVGSMPVSADGRCLLPSGAGLFRATGFVITSGCLLSLAAFNTAGPFRDEFFIDSVDREYGFRLRNRGYHVIQALRPGLVHALGHPHRFRVGPLRLRLNQHAAFRWYYITRNRLLVIAEYAVREPGYCSVEFCLFILDSVRAVMEPQPVRKLGAVIAGIRDAIRRRTGRTHPRWLGGPR